MKRTRIAHWIAIACALVPIPFAVMGIIQLQLWKAEWWALPLAVIYAAILSGCVYGLVRGAFWAGAAVFGSGDDGG